MYNIDNLFLDTCCGPQPTMLSTVGLLPGFSQVEGQEQVAPKISKSKPGGPQVTFRSGSAERECTVFRINFGVPPPAFEAPRRKTIGVTFVKSVDVTKSQGAV